MPCAALIERLEQRIKELEQQLSREQPETEKVAPMNERAGGEQPSFTREQADKEKRRSKRRERQRQRIRIVVNETKHRRHRRIKFLREAGIVFLWIAVIGTVTTVVWLALQLAMVRISTE